jgi:hypothetical protein
LSFVKGEGKNGKRRNRQQDGNAMSPQDGFPLHTTEDAAQIHDGDASAKQAHTPKPASSVHNAPLRETQYTTEFFPKRPTGKPGCIRMSEGETCELYQFLILY